jgi:hypothetical protein
MLIPEPVPLTTGTFVDPKDQRREHYYYKAVDEVLVTQLNRANDVLPTEEGNANDDE